MGAARAVLVVAALSHPNSGLPEFGHSLESAEIG
jgi:hypothetical protein